MCYYLNVQFQGQRVNIQKFYRVFTLRLCVLYGPVPCTALRDRFCITEAECIYCAVRTGSLYKADEFRISKD